jgi:hypothetical protein
LDRINDATLSGIPLLVVMLACFLVGALAARLALELDARALWDAIRRNKKPDAVEDEPSPPGEEATESEAKQ